MRPVLERLFHLSEYGTTVRTEVLAGSTTFFTLAYIIFMQPTALSAAGMDFGSVFVATCIGIGIATLMMAFFANYPIAVAPAMGHNFYFVFTVVVAGGIPWQVAPGGVAVAGMLFRAHGRRWPSRAPDHGDTRLTQACDRGRNRATHRDGRLAVSGCDRRLARHAGHARGPSDGTGSWWP